MPFHHASLPLTSLAMMRNTTSANTSHHDPVPTIPPRRRHLQPRHLTTTQTAVHYHPPHADTIPTRHARSCDHQPIATPPQHGTHGPPRHRLTAHKPPPCHIMPWPATMTLSTTSHLSYSSISHVFIYYY
ncbi:hypothetical protein EDB89DRAFT_1997621 [Lactarius sanguifluus]|nr:hypothetical protein EDB89DRAFT_1997621 [Lactarius sanguifluus]